jgi:arsenite-transporting ATPase
MPFPAEIYHFEATLCWRQALEGGITPKGMARLLLFGGKGGVGKTTCAAATAIWLADAGLRTLLVSSDPAHSTSDSLNFQLGNEPTPVAGVENLWGMELDPEVQMDEMLPKLSEALSGGFGGNMDMFFGQQAKQDIGDELADLKGGDLLLPGLDEALAFDRLLKHLEDLRFDVIVFDTAPTGHTLRFLALPEILESWSGKIARLARTTGGVRSLLFGRKQEAAIQEELDKFQARVIATRKILTDHRLTGFTLVTIPEKMAVDESVRAVATLGEFSIQVEGAIINRITPDLDHEFLQNRRRAEQSYIELLRGEFGTMAIAQVELEDSDIHGIESLRKVGLTLHGEKPTKPIGISEDYFGKQLPLRLRRSFIIEESDEHTALKIHLPNITREKIKIIELEGKLAISIDNREQVLPIEESCRAEFVKVDLVDEILTLTLPF